ncbi:MAG: hypothetical protein HZC49_09525 [Nitrospirae bacterium]|nr:hypothetical protein [Nitrospirota bacterium]
MKNNYLHYALISLLLISACGTTYKAKPLPFKAPGAYPNVMEVAGTEIAAKAYVDSAEAKEAFGFNVREAGMLPVQVIFDNKGSHSFEIDPSQTFLEDADGNLWPVLERNMAYERATKYTQTKEIFKEGAYHGFLGAAAGALIGGAIGIVSGENVGSAIGKGAAAGTAIGGVIGGAKGATSNEANRTVMEDLRQKSLQTKAIEPKALAYGFIFFPGEAKSAKQLRLKLVEKDTGSFHVIYLNL